MTSVGKTTSKTPVPKKAAIASGSIPNISKPVNKLIFSASVTIPIETVGLPNLPITFTPAVAESTKKDKDNKSKAPQGETSTAMVPTGETADTDDNTLASLSEEYDIAVSTKPNVFELALNSDNNGLVNESDFSVPPPGLQVKFKEFSSKEIKDYTSKEIKQLLADVKSGKLTLPGNVALALLENENISEEDIAQINEYMRGQALFSDAFYNRDGYSEYLQSLKRFSKPSALDDCGASTGSPTCSGMGGASGASGANGGYNSNDIADGHQIADNAIDCLDEITMIDKKIKEIDDEINYFSNLLTSQTNAESQVNQAIKITSEELTTATSEFEAAANAYHNRFEGNKTDEEIAQITAAYNEATNKLATLLKQAKENEQNKDAIQAAKNAIQARINQLKEYKTQYEVLREQVLNRVAGDENEINIENLLDDVENGKISISG